ncbi:MAG TPA: type II toxin-antitoxin system VapC family toxin, partial [Candidatus Kapabacteria bacterium]|nr:type II toxin-antitoxin system VapC family toxin [Candidatus Kapabacteria bacterium]
MASREELILLDTHIWLWSVYNSPRLNSQFIEIIEANSDRVCVSVTSCWEIAMLSAKRRLDLEMPASEWFKKVFDQSEIQLLPISPAI